MNSANSVSSVVQKTPTICDSPLALGHALQRAEARQIARIRRINFLRAILFLPPLHVPRRPIRLGRETIFNDR